jgi:hypothetical protein
MKKVYSTLFFVLSASASFAQSGPVLRWQQIVGDITTPGVNNPVAGIASGGAPWTTTGGAASVNLSTGAVTFQVQGLVLNGTNASGTPGPVQNVMGTLVCNAGTSTQATFDTSMVPLSAQGDAVFSGSLGSLPATCATPLFLIRAGTGASASWIATGAVLTTIAS